MMPYLIGIAVFGLLYLFFYKIWTPDWNPASLVIGQDKRPSTSKFQFLLWTAVVAFAYVVVYAARALEGVYAPLDQIPPNLLTAMGFSIVTAAAAKGITVGYLDAGRAAKPEPAVTRASAVNPAQSVAGGPVQRHGGWSCLITDDQGSPDLNKIQMLAWTVIAIGVYLVGLVALVHDIPAAVRSMRDEQGKPVAPEQLAAYASEHPAVVSRISLPDISPALTVLMGLGQGAYLGAKLVTANVARLTQLTPGGGRPGTQVSIAGVQFSEAPDGNQVVLDGKPMAEAPTVVNTSLLRFIFPPTRPDGTSWAPGQVVAVGLISGGQASANTLPFTVAVPELIRLLPDQGLAGTVVALTGRFFGAAQGASRVVVDGVPYPTAINPGDWKDGEIKVTVPATWAAGPHHIRVEIDGQPPTAELVFMVQ
jgi:hypothetical protein